jgi:cell division protease FtsH
MSKKLPNISYYDSTGSEYGFTKPYSDTTAQIIDEEVQRVIAEQYERAKEILRQHAEGHQALTKILFEREVIFTDDLTNIFGKRPWISRSEVLLADEEEKKKAEAQKSSPTEGEGISLDKNEDKPAAADEAVLTDAGEAAQSNADEVAQTDAEEAKPAETEENPIKSQP